MTTENAYHLVPYCFCKWRKIVDFCILLVPESISRFIIGVCHLLPS